MLIRLEKSATASARVSICFEKRTTKEFTRLCLFFIFNIIVPSYDFLIFYSSFFRIVPAFWNTDMIITTITIIAISSAHRTSGAFYLDISPLVKFLGFSFYSNLSLPGSYYPIHLRMFCFRIQLSSLPMLLLTLQISALSRGLQILHR